MKKLREKIKEKIKKFILKLISHEIERVEYQYFKLLSKVETLEREIADKEYGKLRFCSYEEYNKEYQRQLDEEHKRRIRGDKDD